jgi:NTP pyrophosphatase (non-canonical NTP hydrolase)
MDITLEEVLARLKDFREARDWEQFHDPKNLAEAISIEAGELLELFLWKTTEQSKDLTHAEISRLEEEIADILIFLAYLADAFGLDLLELAMKKVELNERKYPVDKAKGSSKKYSELEQ